MSRSHRKSPHTGWTTAESEKKDKVVAHRQVRRAVRQGKEEPIIEPYKWPKDGKQRFDPKKHPDLMRK